MVSWTHKKIYINDTIEISLGKFFLTLFITLFQFLGMLAENGWIVTAGMFFLIANAFLSLSKSRKAEEKAKEELAKLNAEKIKACEEEISKLIITEKDLIGIIKGITKKIEEGKTPSEIVEDIKND